MWMLHSWTTEGMGARTVAGSMVRDLGGMGIRIAANGDDWVLRDDGRALVLC
jgi:hypothetical protein